MADIDVTALRKMIDEAITQWVAGSSPVDASPDSAVLDTPERVLPEGKRAVRTKSSGDRVYCLDEVKKTRQWITNPEILKSLGFEPGDVVDIEDDELLGYQMSAALYKVE